MIKKIIDVILYGCIFISFCGVALCIETALLLHIRLQSFTFYLFVFGATLLQYNLHYLFKKNVIANSNRVTWSAQNKKTYYLLIFSGVLFILISLFGFRLHHFIILSIFGCISVLYSFPFLPFPHKKRIKDFGLLKIITLALLWTLVTVWFPAEQINILDPSYLLIFIRRFIFIFILCLLFDIRDTEIDRLEKISTISVKIGAKKSYWLCYILLAVFAILSLLEFVFVKDIFVLTAMLISALATIIIIEVSKKNNADFIYLFCIDGMMILQALLVMIASEYLH